MLKQYNGLLAAFPQIVQKRFISAASVAVKMQKNCHADFVVEMKRDDDQVLQWRSVNVGVASENAAAAVVVVVNAVVEHEVG